MEEELQDLWEVLRESYGEEEIVNSIYMLYERGSITFDYFRKMLKIGGYEYKEKVRGDMLPASGENSTL